MPHIIVFAASFIQSLIATLEVANISRGRCVCAGVMSALNALTYAVIAILLIVDENRVELVSWYVIGTSIGTIIGTYYGRKNGQH